MPIEIQPDVLPVAVLARIVAFEVNLTDGNVAITLAYIDANGVELRPKYCTCALYHPDGSPRFDPTLYAALRADLYGMAIADGYVSGTVS